MTAPLPVTSQHNAWWKLLGQVRQHNLPVGTPGFDPTVSSALKGMAVPPNYAPTPSAQTGSGSRWQSGPTPWGL